MGRKAPIRKHPIKAPLPPNPGKHQALQANSRAIEPSALLYKPSENLIRRKVRLMIEIVDFYID